MLHKDLKYLLLLMKTIKIKHKLKEYRYSRKIGGSQTGSQESSVEPNKESRMNVIKNKLTLAFNKIPPEVLRTRLLSGIDRLIDKNVTIKSLEGQGQNRSRKNSTDEAIEVDAIEQKRIDEQKKIDDKLEQKRIDAQKKIDDKLEQNINDLKNRAYDTTAKIKKVISNEKGFAQIVIATEKPLVIEKYVDFPFLGRFVLLRKKKSIALGIKVK